MEERIVPDDEAWRQYAAKRRVNALKQL